jgi:hypothetical protein
LTASEDTAVATDTLDGGGECAAAAVGNCRPASPADGCCCSGLGLLLLPGVSLPVTPAAAVAAPLLEAGAESAAVAGVAGELGAFAAAGVLLRSNVALLSPPACPAAAAGDVSC